VKHPTFDFETRSAAGFVWNEEDECWEGPPGAADCGLALVGVKNYIAHPTFQVLSLSYDILDGQGASLWTPWSKSPPTRLLRHIALRGITAGWNVGGFEFHVWNDFCVKAYGWPPLLLEQLVDDMAAARAWTLPGSLANVGDVLKLDVVKDKTGKELIKKFTVPRQPTKANKAIWNEPDDPDLPPPTSKKRKDSTIVHMPSALVDNAAYDAKMQLWRDAGSIEDDIPF